MREEGGGVLVVECRDTPKLQTQNLIVKIIKKLDYLCRFLKTCSFENSILCACGLFQNLCGSFWCPIHNLPSMGIRSMVP